MLFSKETLFAPDFICDMFLLHALSYQADEGDDDAAADEADSDDADTKLETKEDVTVAAEENFKVRACLIFQC